MPTVLRAECKSFVDAYGPDIVALLAREFDPAKTCQLIKVCPKSTDVAFLTQPNPKICGLCDYVSTYLAANYPIENVCKHFSTDNNIKQQCEILVHLHKPNICPQLPLCFDEVVIKPLEQPIATNVEAVQCSLCKYLVGYVDKVLGNNKSSAAVEAALDKACNILPTPVRTECTTFAHKYAPLIAILIAKNATPEEVCDFLKVCHNGTQEIHSKY
jgi:saposin